MSKVKLVILALCVSVILCSGKKIAVMNFANAFHAGGGVVKGASAENTSRRITNIVRYTAKQFDRKFQGLNNGRHIFIWDALAVLLARAFSPSRSMRTKATKLPSAVRPGLRNEQVVVDYLSGPRGKV